MFHKKTLLTLAVLGLILSAGVVSANAFSGKGQGMGKNTEWQNLIQEERQAQREEFRAERETEREQMNTIFTNNDYNAWVEIMKDKPNYDQISEKITPENFAKFAEMHNLKQAGDMEGSKAIADELGINGVGFGKGMGGRRFKGEMREGGIGQKGFQDKNGDGYCDNLDWK